MKRREFMARLGRGLAAGAASMPFLSGLPSMAAKASRAPRQRVVFIFSPNGIVPPHFWPDNEGAHGPLKRILAPLEPFKDRLITIHGLANKVRGDGDGHMRGMSCLLTGIELFPGNIQGGSDTPAGWASGPSIDQEIARFLASKAATRTRFASLELGVAVPNRADPWTRWTYAGPNQPVAPVSDPYQVFERLYGGAKDRVAMASVLDGVREDLRRATRRMPREDRELLERHATEVRALEKDLKEAAKQRLAVPPPALEPGVGTDNDDMPRASALQRRLLVNALANDMTRVASLQYTNSVGQARMRWLGVEEGHHSLSHDPDLNEGSQEKLVKINTWFAAEIAALAMALDAVPEPGGHGSLLDHTTLLWTNELGKGNTHALENIPFVLAGGGLGLGKGRAVKLKSTPHNRLWLAMAHAVGHELKTFGNPRFCEAGPLSLA